MPTIHADLKPSRAAVLQAAHMGFYTDYGWNYQDEYETQEIIGPDHTVWSVVRTVEDANRECVEYAASHLMMVLCQTWGWLA